MISLNRDVSPADAMEANRRNWDSRVPVHLGPDGYGIDEIACGNISSVVRFDVEAGRLQSVEGLDVVHLQCHIGTDTISFAHLGARAITGLDFSAPALAAAAGLSQRLGLTDRARWVEASVYDAATALGATYDLVYTGVGAINWLPDLASWARVVATLLRSGGLFHITEAHPLLYATSEQMTADQILLDLPYLSGGPPWESNDEVTYAGTGAVTSPQSFEWPHSLSEVIQSLIDAGLAITHFSEHRRLPWAFADWMDDVEGWPGWKQMPERFRDVVPMMFTLQARKG